MTEILLFILLWLYLVGAMVVWGAFNDVGETILWRQILLSFGWPIMVPALYVGMLLYDLVKK